MPYQLKTPGVVVTAGVLLIVYGSLMLTCGVCGGFGLAINDPGDDELAAEVPGYAIVQVGETASNLLIGVAMILSGVGVLRLMPIARIGGYATSIYEIVLAVFHSVYNIVFVFPAVEAQNAPPMPFNFGGLLTGSMWFGLIIGLALTLGLCGPIIYLLSVPAARAAFADEFQGEPPRDSGRRHGDLDDDDDDSGAPAPRPFDPGHGGIKERPW